MSTKFMCTANNKYIFIVYTEDGKKQLVIDIDKRKRLLKHGNHLISLSLPSSLSFSQSEILTHNILIYVFICIVWLCIP